MEIFEGYVHTCPVCGKEFYAHADWGYQIREPKNHGRGIFLCSWKCLRKMQEENEAKKKRGWWSHDG